jgi:hypothetical protein
MQSQRTADASALSGSVRGLGVCDALRVELVTEQLPGLIEQLEAHRAALQDEIERRRAAVMPRDPRGTAQLEDAENELHLIELLRSELPTAGESFVVIGPAGPVGVSPRRDAPRRRGALRAGARDQPARRRRTRSAYVRGGCRRRLGADLHRGASGRGLQPRHRARPRIDEHQMSRPSNASCVPSASATMSPDRASRICSSALT